jgi:diguanylate cyclase (GGDEF)-like protein
MRATIPTGRLQFADPRLERLFWRDYERHPGPLRSLALLGIATMLLFAAVDLQLAHRMLPAVLAWRTLTVLGPALLLLALLVRPRRRGQTAWVAGAVILMGAGGAGVIAHVDAEHADIHQAGVLILLVLAYTGLRLPFRMALSVGLVIGAADVLALRTLVLSHTHLALSALYLLAVNVVGMLTAYGRERLLRERFVDHLTLWREHSQLERLTRRLERLSLRDDLTGLSNRRELDAQLSAALATSERTGQLLTLAVLDLDRFKEVNDRFGHAAGDQLLRRVAQVMEQEVRRGDVVFRYGGDEFCVLMPDTRIDEGAAVMERLRSRLVDATARDPVTVGFSAGCAQSRPGDDSEALLRRADARLYVAKEAGRGRVCADSPTQLPVPRPAPELPALRRVG